MELFKLNNDDNYKPSTSVSKMKMLIWTERYRAAGDFKIVVEDDISILTVLPKGCLISHTDTKEVMIVEDHKIKRKKKKLEVEVTGRSLETFAENRVTEGSTYPLYDGSDQAIVEIFGPASASSGAQYLLSEAMDSTDADVPDRLPNLVIYKDMRVEDDDMTQNIVRGDVYSRALELMALCDAGVKNVRPVGAEDHINMVVHDGADRTVTVVFYAQKEDLEDAEYFSSIRNNRNYAMVSGRYTAREVRDRNVGSDQTGFARRVIYVPAEDLEGDYDPGSVGDELDARGQNVLGEHRDISLIGGTVSVNAKPKFKKDYDVGDLVTVYGEFGVSQVVRITEYILTVEKNGISGYPSFAAV